MEKYTIARAENRDVQDLKMIEVECGLSPWTVEAYESELGRPESIVFVARSVDNLISGFLAGRAPLGEEGVAEIFNIGILPRFRRERIGSMLIEEFRRICVDRGISVIWLEVRAKNRAAMEFYRSHGFVNNGVRRNFYSDPTEDAELMSLAVI